MASMGLKKTVLLEHFVVNYFNISCCACAKQKQASQDELKKLRQSGELPPHWAPLPERRRPSRTMEPTRPKTTSPVTSQRVISSAWARILLATALAVSSHALIPVLFPPSTPVVNTSDGPVRGRTAYSRAGKLFWQFSSIPYAKPPVGHLIFAPPQPVEPWEDVKEVRAYPPFCLQFEAVITQTVFGELDCLYLNVFAPPFQKGDAKRAVLVHVHGGGFLAGSSRLHGPEYLMDHDDLVVVTFNYRLGPFGFLNLGQTKEENDEVDLPRGNMGLKDQRQVLLWVQKNIAQFGGDPKRVTLIGESAGAVSVNLQALSPKSRGLFHRAISQSGSAFCSWGFTTQPRQVAKRYVEKMECPWDNSTALKECLENYDPRKMVRFQVSVTDPTLLKDNLSPSVETVLREDTFLSEHPTDIIASGNFSKVPTAWGLNSGEGALRTGRFDALPHAASELRSRWKDLLGNVLLLDKFPKSVADRVRNFYFGGRKFPSDIHFKETLTVLFSDVFAFEPVTRAAKDMAAVSDAPTYFYFYDYTPRVFPGIYSFFKASTPHDWLPQEVNLIWTLATDWISEKVFGGKGAHQYGVSHAEDMFLLWNSYYSTLGSYWEQDFSKSFVRTLVEFAQGTTDLKFRGVPWPYATIPGNSSKENPVVVPYMLMDNSNTARVIAEPFAHRLRFWESIGVRSFN